MSRHRALPLSSLTWVYILFFLAAFSPCRILGLLVRDFWRPLFSRRLVVVTFWVHDSGTPGLLLLLLLRLALLLLPLSATWFECFCALLVSQFSGRFCWLCGLSLSAAARRAIFTAFRAALFCSSTFPLPSGSAALLVLHFCCFSRSSWSSSFLALLSTVLAGDFTWTS